MLLSGEEIGVIYDEMGGLSDPAYALEAINLTERVAKAQLKRDLDMGLQFHVADREVLGEVGKWAEGQDVGVFIYLTKEEWQSLRKEVE